LGNSLGKAIKGIKNAVEDPEKEHGYNSEPKEIENTKK